MSPTNKKPAIGLMIGVGPKGPDDGPAPLGSPEDQDLDNQASSPNDTCATCRYFSDGDMQCKRYPQWVDHMPEDWCGEFRSGPQHKDAHEADEMQMPHGQGAPPQQGPSKPDYAGAV